MPTQEKRNNFLKLGMDDCLAKPIDEIALQKIIQRWHHTDMPNKPKVHPLSPQEKQLNVSFDWPLALQQSAGKEDLGKEMLTLLLDEFPSMQRSTEDFMYTNIKPDVFAKILHKFHGGCSYSGVPRLINIIKELEKGMKKKSNSGATWP